MQHTKVYQYFIAKTTNKKTFQENQHFLFSLFPNFQLSLFYFQFLVSFQTENTSWKRVEV